MGHYCRICGKNKPNEKFSGKGHKNHICKECSRKPKSEIDEIDLLSEISGFLSQSNISRKNIKRLSDLTKFEKVNIAEMAEIVLEIAKVNPHKRKRLKSVGTSLVGVHTFMDVPGDADDINIPCKTGESAINRTGTRPVPLFEIIGAFKSINTNQYINCIKQNNWPPFRKRL